MGLRQVTLKEIVKQLLWCGYECEAGPLENNAAFRLLESLEMDEYEADDGTTQAVEATAEYRWNPHRDISVYELALCLPYLVIVPYGMDVHKLDALPDHARRHFHKFLPGVKAY